MSDFLFPRARSKRRLELRLALLAVVILTAFGLCSAWLGASFIGVVGGDVRADARLVTVGDSLGINSSVKFRGLRVGRVVDVDSRRGSDRLYGAHVVIDEEYADDIPADVVARVLPGTLFGAEYVDLALPGSGVPGRRTVSTPVGGPRLRDGAVIPADTRRDSIRLMDTFSAMHRVISAIDPAALDLAMSQLAGALDGKGDDLGRFISRASRLVGEFSAMEPTFYRDLALLSQNLDTLADVEPDLAASLRNALPVAATIARKARAIDRIMRSSTSLSAEISSFLEHNSAQLVRLLGDVAPTYRAFVGGTAAFVEILRLAPGVLVNGSRAIKDGAIQMTAQFAVDHYGPYSSADCSRYGALQGSNCR